MKKTLKKSLGMAFAGSLLMASSALALPYISGSVSMSDGFTPTGGSGLGNATGIDFTLDKGHVDPGGADGDFLALNSTDLVMKDFTFNPSTPVAALWSGGGFTFNLDSVSTAFQNNFALILEGTGTVVAAGYADTPGNWIFTSQTASGTNFSWSASSAAVPEPATMLLMGTGLAGLMSVIRRKRED